ncbi:MAG: xanthine dehydrogenase family protein molybdopterin-binding subunit [Lautropia sp.]
MSSGIEHGAFRPDASVRIGDAAQRVEDGAFLRGQAVFLDDVPCPENVLHATFLRSPHAHARLSSIDTRGALGLPGVVAVLTAADLRDHLRPFTADFERPGFRPVAREVLASDRVRFVGDGVALCLAADPYVALDAIEEIQVDYEPLPAVVTAEAAVGAAFLLYDSVPDNTSFHSEFASPDFEARHAAAPLRLRERFSCARIACVALEPRGCIAEFDAARGKLHFWSSTQVPHLLRACLAEHLGLPEADVVVRVPAVGGGFGGKTSVYPEELAVAAAAIRLRTPVKWVQDRYDDFLTTTQAREHGYDVEAGYDGSGRLLSLDARVTVNIGAYPMLPFGSSLESNGAPRNLPGPYALRHFRYRTRSVLTNTCPTGAYRGVAAPLACFVMEGVMDRIARALSMDPAEVRRRNLVTSFPYLNVLGLEYREGCFGAALDRALELSRYAQRRKAQRRYNARRAHRRMGIGVAVVTEQTGMGSARYRARGLLRVPGHERASIAIAADGVVTVRVSLVAQGQGHATAWAQIASDVLGVPLRDVRVVAGDTSRTPDGTGTFASRGMALAGSALLRAAQQLRARLARAASMALDAPAEALQFADARVCVSGAAARAVPLREAARLACAADQADSLEVSELGDSAGMTLASAVHVVTVQVDLQTGMVHVGDYVVVHDCGRMVNPLLVDGQIQGAVVQGIGEVLKEQVRYSAEGEPLCVNLLDYHLPRASELRRITIDAVHSPAGAAEFKGVGESGTIGAVPAVSNAVADALSDLGVGVSTLPVDPHHLRALIAAARSSRTGDAS